MKPKELLNKLNILNMYQLMILFLTILLSFGLFDLFQAGTAAKVITQVITAITQIITALFVCILLEIFFNYIKSRVQQQKFAFKIPYSAIITALLIAGILAPETQWYIIAVASSIAIAIKHIAKSLAFVNNHTVFNPTALGIVTTAIIFSSANSWWIASNIYLVILFGLIIAYKIRRHYLAISYIIAHSIIFALYAFFKYGPKEIINYLLFANLFFAFFMLIEPKTSPAQPKKQWIYGAIVAALAFVFLQLAPTLDHNLMALLISNIVLFLTNKKIY